MAAKRRLRLANSRGRPARVPATYALPWRDAFDIVPVPIWMIGAHGTLCFGNRAWHRLIAADQFPERQNGTGWLQAVHERDRHGTLAAFRDAAASCQRLEVDLRLRSPDGCRTWSLTGAPHAGPSGDVLMFVGTAADTTATQEAEARLRELGARLIAAQEAERTRIARELHDDLAQQVALLATKLGMTSRRRPFTAKLVRQDLAAVRDMLRDLTDGIHVLSHELHPPRLALLGLSPTLHALCDEIAHSCRTPIRFKSDVEVIDVAEPVALCIFRVTQEALHNAVKHSGASQIDVGLVADTSQLTLRVADNGRGFDPSSLADGLGLMTMRERVELVHGRLGIVSGRGRGTFVEAVVPFLPKTPPVIAATTTCR